MRKWVKVRFGLTFQDPESIIKYVKELSKQDPKNRQAALAMVLAWINLQLGNTMNAFAKDENASEKTVSELETIIIYLAKGWDKKILDFSEKEPAAVAKEQPQATPPAPAPSPQAIPAKNPQAQANSIAQNTKMVKATYATKPDRISLVGKKLMPGYASKKKAVTYQDPKRAMMKGRKVKLFKFKIQRSL